MKRTILLAIGLLFLGQPAAAATSWALISFSATPQNAPKVLAAADKLMMSETGKQFPGRLHLQVSTADGNNPATHSFVPIYKSAKEREDFVQKLQADPAWNVFMKSMTDLTEPVSVTMNRVVKTWGNVDDTDKVWMAHAFTVRDPAAFVAALEKFMASATGKKFPGQVYLSQTVAGGISPITHVISVGYQSEAEMESWVAMRDATPDWTAYVDASRQASDYLGASMARDLKIWGPASLKNLAMP